MTDRPFISYFRVDRTGVWTEAQKRAKQLAKKPVAKKARPMSRAHAARQLLALGPLSFMAFAEIMGGSVESCRRVLSYLVDDLGEVARQQGLYRIEDGKQLPDLPELEAEGKRGDGETAIRPLCPGAALGVSASLADVREAQAGCCGRCSREGCMGQQGVSSGEVPYMFATFEVRA